MTKLWHISDNDNDVKKKALWLVKTGDKEYYFDTWDEMVRVTNELNLKKCKCIPLWKVAK